MSFDVFTSPHRFLILAFCLGYAGIIFEYFIHLNKAALSLFMAVVCWLIYFLWGGHPLETRLDFLNTHLSSVSQILFFLLGAMTMVELIDSHKGFNVFIHYLETRSKRQMLWIISLISFCLSAILDNLTTTILMLSILKKLIPIKKERLIYCCIVVVAANAGGVWTPIGDVTTTMLWIGGQVTTFKLVTHLLIPSLISLLFPLVVFTFSLKGTFPEYKTGLKKGALEPGGQLVFFVGLLLFLFVPIFKALTGLPPFMGMIISLAIMWLMTDVLHYKGERHHLRVPHILTKVDVSSILFFLGILLSVNALESTGILEIAAKWLNVHMKNEAILASTIGLVSAVIDNVPLVAATMGMYDLNTVPTNSPLWLMITYAAGTGGSVLVMGSSAGVALMGAEKVDFLSYLKKMSLPVLIGYLLGMAFYAYLF